MEDRKELEESDESPAGINPSMWQKFQKLKRRRQELSTKSTAKRIKQIQKEAIEKVTEDFEKTNDVDALQSHNVDLPGNREEPEFAKSISSDKNNEAINCSNIENPSSEQPVISGTKAWMDFKPYIDINAHLKGIDRGKCAPKTGLEEKIDAAIELGEYSEAEKLSDRLSTREMGAKIADAFDAQKYAVKKKEEDERVKLKQQKKLKWGFEHKQRWEMKGNM